MGQTIMAPSGLSLREEQDIIKNEQRLCLSRLRCVNNTPEGEYAYLTYKLLEGTGKGTVLKRIINSSPVTVQLARLFRTLRGIIKSRRTDHE